MALVESTSIKLGSKMPDFTLNDPHGTPYTLTQNLGSNGTLIAFTCNHCPYAIAVWPRLIELSKYAQSHNIRTVAINPNIHPDYPDDAPEVMIKKIKEWQIPFPYLVDEHQDIARQYNAQCTPDIYLIDSTQALVYHGRIDDNWKDPKHATKHDLRDAITALGSAQSISSSQWPSMGCSIKWQI